MSQADLLDDRYELQELLGQGRIGRVYRARDRLEVRQVALKIPHEWHSRNPEFKARFRRELLTGARLDHPAIVRSLDRGEQDGTPFLVMEIIEGASIENWFCQTGRDYQRLAVVLDEILAALAHAHAQGVVHQELKPANILVDANHHPHILDFGLAGRLEDQLKLSQGPQHSLAYISPEQAMGERGDERSDLYALGAVLFHILAERPPFVAESSPDYLLAHLNQSPAPISSVRGDVPVWLERLVGRLLIRDPSQRPQSASEVQQWVRRHRAAPVPRRRDPLWGRELEQARLEELLAGLSEGRGALVRIGGEPGVGKSRLAEELLDRARQRGHRVETVEATEGAVLHLGMISRRFADPGAPLVERLVECAMEQPVVLLVEGVHRAHESVAELLRELVTVVDEVPLLVVVTDRPGAAESDTVREMVVALPVQLELKGLDEAACGHLIEERTWHAPSKEALAWFTTITGGNPLFVQLLAEHLEEAQGDAGGPATGWIQPSAGSFPDSLRELLGHKLERQGPEALAVLGVAACLGERFEFNLLKAVTYLDDRQLEVLLEQLGGQAVLREEWASGLVQYRFANVTLWNLALERIPRRRQRRVHLLAARFLEKSAHPPVTKLARHYSLAGDTMRALRYRAQATEQSRDRGEVGYHYVQLLELARQIPDWPGPPLSNYRADYLPRTRHLRALIAWALVAAGAPELAAGHIDEEHQTEVGPLKAACYLAGVPLDPEQVESALLQSFRSTSQADAPRVAAWLVKLYRRAQRWEDVAEWSRELEPDERREPSAR